MPRRFLAALPVVALLIAGLTGAASPAASDTASATYIVTLKPGQSPAQAARELTTEQRGRVAHVYEHALKGFAFNGSATAAANIARSPRVARVEQDRPVYAVGQVVPVGVSRIDADDTLAAGRTGAGVSVAVIDTGVDLDHPDLVGRIAPIGKDCVNNDAIADDDNGHGTHVAGTVAATNNSDGVVGVAPSAAIVPVKVLGATGSGTWSSILCGIDFVTQNATSIKVANLSLGGSGTAGSSCAASSLRQAICNSVSAGVTYTAAAGNSSQDAGGFVPAAYPEVIAVSAFNVGTSSLASFSNYGSVVDVMAPGTGVYSTVMNGGYGSMSGTSMAAPHVAGVAALVAAADASLTPAQVRDRVRSTGECPGATTASSTGACVGTWTADPDGIAEPLVNANRASSTVSTTEPVATEPAPTPTEPVAADPAPAPAPAIEITSLKATRTTNKVARVEVRWSNATTAVDIYRNGSKVFAATANDGVQVDSLGKVAAGRTYTYKVCAAGTTSCSTEQAVTTV